LFLTKHASTPVELKADAAGHIDAVFSTFGVVDSDGDILVREAFTDGQEAPLVWSHDWSRPVGKGVIRTDEKRAIFSGDFFMDTTDGADAYRTVKAMGSLQEFSWGFRILDAEPGDKDGMPVRYITKAELFEVSPVLVGANRETYTLAIKSADLKRHLSRQHMDRIIAVILEALNADEVVEDEDVAPADAGKALTPLAFVDAYVAGLSDSDEAALLDERERIEALLAETRSAGATLDALLKRVDDIGAENPRELFRQFRRLEGLYGPIHGGRRAG
jgi:HK97 family phage prohead protease